MVDPTTLGGIGRYVEFDEEFRPRCHGCHWTGPTHEDIDEAVEAAWNHVLYDCEGRDGRL